MLADFFLTFLRGVGGKEVAGVEGVTDHLQKNPHYSSKVGWKNSGKPVYQPMVLFSCLYLKRGRNE